MQQITPTDRLKQYWADVRAGKLPPPERRKTNEHRHRVRADFAPAGALIVIVYDHGEIGIRAPGRRWTYRIGLADVYRNAALIAAMKISARIRALVKTGERRSKARKLARREVLGY